MHRLGSTAATLKLKGIDGGPHKRWSMWLNSRLREEPYLGLTYRGPRVKARFPACRTSIQVLHGCRQLVSCDVRLSPATSATRVVSCHQVMLGTLARPPVSSGRKARMTSSPYGPYIQGCTRATMAGTESCDVARRSESRKPVPVRIGVCNSTP